MSRLRSVVVLNDAAFVDGGASQVGVASAVGLATRGLDVAFIAANGPVSPDLQSHVRVRCTNQAKIGDDPDRARAAARGIWNFQAAKAVRDELREHDPRTTVVHVHNWTKALSSSALQMAVHAGFKVVITLHDYFAACPNGTYYDHRRQEICTRRAMGAACIGTNCDSRNYATKLYRVSRQFVQRNVGRVPPSIRHFIYVSDLSFRIIAPYLPSDGRGYKVRNPIDTPYAPAAIDAGQNDTFTYVGRLSPEKGVTMLATAAVKAQVPLVIVGDGEERERIHNVNPDALITGWLPRSLVWEKLQHARALVLPSLWYEALALVVSEAAALGIPAIVPDTCAASELVIHERNGLIFHGGSLDSLAEAVTRLRDPHLARSLGSEAYSLYWASPATLAAHLDELLLVYEKVLSDT